VDSKLLTKLWYSRLTPGEIAERMGHSTQTLRRHAKKIGLPADRRELWKKVSIEEHASTSVVERRGQQRSMA
jgi:hypothetical protein